MKKENITEIMNGVSTEYIDEAIGYEHTKRNSNRRWIQVAACFIGLVIMGLSITAITVSAKEYDTAKEFFTANGLSTEGLTPSEIKSVYRDIVTKSFSKEKTAEVIAKAIPGIEWEADYKNSEDVQKRWEEYLAKAHKKAKNGITYEVVFADAEEDAWALQCFEDGNLLWNTDFGPSVYVTDAVYTSNGTAVWGMTAGDYVSGEQGYPWLARLDENGKIIWKKKIDCGEDGNNYAAKVLENADKTWAVFGVCNGNIFFGKYDADGNRICFNKTQIEKAGVGRVVKVGTDFLIQTSGRNGIVGLIKMDKDGNVENDVIFEAENIQFYPCDVIEYEGRVYVSAVAVPKPENGNTRQYIGNIVSQIAAREEWDVSQEEVLEYLRNDFTAVLFLCQKDNLELKTFYSVKGAAAGSLSVNESGQMEWNVNNFESAKFSPLTSTYSIAAVCSVTVYTFDADGAPVNRIDTDKVISVYY